MSHTPGPWQVKVTDEGALEREFPFWVAVQNKEHFIADVLLGSDARLIAAAPELLEALRRIQFVLTQLDPLEVTAGDMQDLGDAIAKATATEVTSDG